MLTIISFLLCVWTIDGEVKTSRPVKRDTVVKINYTATNATGYKRMELLNATLKK